MQLLATEEQVGEDGAMAPRAYIDRVTESDLEPIKQLFREAFEINHPGGDWRKVRRAVSLELRKTFDAQRTLGGPMVLVARASDGAFLGYIWWKYDTGPDAASEAFVQGLGTVKAHRSAGVGKLLVSAMVQWVHRNLSALDAPVRRITCAVSPRNAPVLKVIESMGGDLRYAVFCKDIEPMEVR